MSFTFVHAADLHLDSPFKGLSHKAFAPKQIEEATFSALERLVSICLREEARFLLLSGDLYDAKERSLRAKLFLHDQLFRLHQAGIKTFIVHGNHDPLDGETGGLNLPPSVFVFQSHWEEVELRDEAGRVYCRVQGISYPTEMVSKNLTKFFRRQGPEFSVGLLHTNVGGHAGHANYAPCSLTDLSEAQLDYWALGHVHTRTEYSLSNGGLAVYPGNLQGRHINEPGPRGCVVVKVLENQPSTQFVPAHAYQWEELTVSIEGLASVNALIDKVEESILDTLNGIAPSTRGVLRLVLSGRGPLHGHLKGEGLAGLEEWVRQRMASMSNRVELESLRDATATELDVAGLLQGSGLLGMVGKIVRENNATQLIEDIRANAQDLKKLGSSLERFGISKWVDAPEDLIQEASRLAVELLMEGDS